MPTLLNADARNYAQVSDHTALLAYIDNENLRWNYGQDLGTPVVVSYSFTSGGDLPSVAEYDPFGAVSYWAFDALDQGYFRQAIAVIEAVTGVIFVETSDTAMVNVFGADAYSVGGWADYAYATSSFTGSGNFVSADRYMAPGEYGFQILLHELGHALGLQHPHDGGSLTLDPQLDNPSNTVMTYNNSGPNVTELGRFDIDALQDIYGRASQTSGWNVFVAQDDMITIAATSRSETLMATGQDTRINAFGGNDTVLGREGADELNGNGGNDSLVGGVGTDLLVGGSGNDRMFGDYADNDYTGVADTLFGGAGSDTISGGGGADLINGGWARDVLEGGYGNDTIRGNYGADEISGWFGSDLIFGEGGRDDIDSGSDDDIVYGGNGGDTILGGFGNDLIGGGNGADRLFGQAGDDSLYAGAGNDNVAGGADNDIIGGGADSDSVNGGTGDDTIFGGVGLDVLSGNAGNDTIYGGDWADVIYGGSGGDFLAGGNGSDTLIGGGGSDILVGGAGADTFRFSSADNFYDDSIRDFQNGIDRIVFDFDGLGFGDLYISSQNGNTSITGAGNLALTLIGVGAAQIDESDFLFV